MTKSAHVWTPKSVRLVLSTFAWFVVFLPAKKFVVCRALDILATITREEITLTFTRAIHWVVVSTFAAIVVIDPSHGTLAKLVLTSGTTAGSTS